MPGPIELRIHGVGGSTPHALLGQPLAEDVRLHSGDEKSGFCARRNDQSVEGYVWGPLTSGSRLQPLWIVLLPFTLLNVAGWMHRPVTSRSQRRVWWTRWLVTVLGFTLTVTSALWLCVVLADFMAYRAGGQVNPISAGQLLAIGVSGLAIAGAGFAWRGRSSRAGWPLVILGIAVLFGGLAARTAASPGWRGTWGVVGAGLIMLAIFLIAGWTRGRFENMCVLEEFVQPKRQLSDNETLASPSFFAHPEDSRWLLRWHAVTTVVTLIVAIALVWKRAEIGMSTTLSFGSLFVAVGTLQFILLGALVLVSLGEWDRLDRRWRIAGPAVAATSALILTNGFFAGLALWVRQRLQTGQAPERLGPEFALLDVFVGATLIFIAIMLLVWLPYFLVAKPSDAADALKEPQDWRGRVALRRRLARAFRHIDIPLSIWALGSLAAGAIVGLLRLTRTEGCVGICLTLEVERFGMAPLRSLGEWVLPFLPIVLSLVIRLGARSIGARRNIGNLWDVLTFWPRRFHPLGVRPYAERAVPELQRHLQSQRAATVVSAHSQGSVLAFAALQGLNDPSLLRRVALVTYGSPLDRLHARFFPHYFNAEEFRALRGKLFDQQDGWRNFYRQTDHIGQQVFNEVPEAAPNDQPLPDPVASTPVYDPSEPPLERDLEPFRMIAGHNYYLRERQLKDWVAEAKQRLRERPGVVEGSA